MSKDLPKLRSPIMSKARVSTLIVKSTGADHSVVLLFSSNMISFHRSTCLIMNPEAARSDFSLKHRLSSFRLRACSATSTVFRVVLSLLFR